jgi:hypothetical protein
MPSSTTKSNEKKKEPAQRAPSALEQCIVESSAGGSCEATVVVKGLPSDHLRAHCMGGYNKQERTMNGRSVYVGGRDGDMALYFDNTHWEVTTEEDIDVGGCLMHTNEDPAITPDRIKAPWKVDQGQQPALSVRVHKFRGRESILELSGLPSDHIRSHCMGRYTREVHSHNDNPAYKSTRQEDGMAIWFSHAGHGCWCVGYKKNIGTDHCSISVEDCACTPDVVQSTWMVATGRAEYDKRVHVCGASAQQSSAAEWTARQTQQLSSAPPKLAVIGSDMERESFDGIYTKQRYKFGSRVVYEGGRNGNQAIWCLKAETWVIGDAEDIGTGRSAMQTQSPAITPDAVTGTWSVPAMVPCSSIRVSKSKKKHTKVIEVKGIFSGNGVKGVTNLVVAQKRIWR